MLFVHASASAACRSASEDRAAVLARGDSLVVVVADGAGGMSGGAAAATALVAAVTDACNATAPLRDTATWLRLFEDVDRDLAAGMQGETTGIVVVLSPHGLVGASVGDSAAWIVGDDGVDDLTRAQRKARLGSGRAMPVAFHRERLEGVLVVGTDGLFKYAAPSTIAEAVRGCRPEDAATRLLGLVRLPSGAYQDDVAVVVVAAR